MIEEKPFLESLTILTGWDIRFEELMAIVSALQLDTTLNTLDVQPYDFFNNILTEDEVKQLVSILMKKLWADVFLAGLSSSRGRFEAEQCGTPVSDRRRIFDLKRCRRIEYC
jgi:hypothetical protein